jgi:hypothetical protein
MRVWRLERSPHRSFSLTLLLVSFVVVGCGSGGSGSSQGSGSSARRAFELNVAGCDKFTVADAAEFLGLPAGALKDKSQDISDQSRWCIYSDAQDPRKGVTFTVEREESVNDAVIAFQQFRDHVGVAVGVLGEAGDKAHNVEGLGDEALWTPVPGGVYARKGRYSVQVNGPSPRRPRAPLARGVCTSTTNPARFSIRACFR